MNRSLRRILGFGGAAALAGTLFAFQLPFREYPGVTYSVFPLPSDASVKGEFVFGRLMYPEIRGRDSPSVNTAWKHAKSIWTQDYPRADRYFLLALRRLTRINARSVEQPVDLDDGDDMSTILRISPTRDWTLCGSGNDVASPAFASWQPIFCDSARGSMRTISPNF